MWSFLRHHHGSVSLTALTDAHLCIGERRVRAAVPVLGSVFVGIGDEVASGLGVVMVLRRGQSQRGQISCKRDGRRRSPTCCSC